jgi:alpha-ribazole phosphatase
VLPQGLVAHHSPLQRCELLALTLSALRADLAIESDARLAEMDFGAWEGRAWSAIARSGIDAWTADFTGQRPGGGESLAAMLERVAAALRQARQAAARQQCDVLWISHAGVARCVQWLLAAPPTDGDGDGDALSAAPRAHQWPVAAPAFGTWTTFPL